MIRVRRYLLTFALATSLVAVPAASFAGVFVGIGIGGGGVGLGVSVGIAPPPLPVYEQPPCLVPDTIWTPGYWAYGPYGYYWVPGTWVAAPQAGYLWTPGYWGYDGGEYAWHGGYWGPHVGFYGGVNYGFGYGGYGYNGGGWNGDHFRYNTAYTNVNRTTIDNVYINRTVVNNYDGAVNRTSYNGGEYGLRSRPTAEERAYGDERHIPLTPVQRQHIETAAQNRNYQNSVNHGRPNDAAVATPLGRENRPPGFSPATDERRDSVRGANTLSREGSGRTTTDPFSRFDRSAPSVRDGSVPAHERAPYAAARSTSTDPYARFARRSPSYARANQATSASSRLGRAITPDPYARFDRNGSNRAAHAYGTSQRSYGTAARSQAAAERSYDGDHSYRAERAVTDPAQASARAERSNAAAENRYYPNATYRSHPAPQAERPAERSRPTAHSEARHGESSNHREH